jgi:hypothetical protein
MKFNQDIYKSEKDILKQLRFVTATPCLLRQLEKTVIHMWQKTSGAADEIDRLRKEVKAQKRELKKLRDKPIAYDE